MDGYVTIGTKLDTTGLDKSLSQLESSINSSMSKIQSSTEKGFNGLTRTVTRSFSSLKRFILGLGIARLISRMFSMDDAISRVDTINNYARVMGNLGISADKAEKSIKILSDKLIGLPTTLDDAANSVQRFTSANSNIEASTEMFLALNNAILAGGASTEIQKSALEQLSQAYAKGKPDMMEWRTAMMAMPAQLKQIATAMGFVSSSDLGEALRKGTVSMNDFMATVTRLNKQGLNGFQSFADQAKNSTGGIATAITNLKTAFTRALADIMNAVGQSNIAEFFNGIARAINRVVPYIAGFVKAMLMLFGINKKTKSTVDTTAKSLESLGSSGVNTSDGMNKAAGSAKKLNKELKGLASFDEMNVLPDKTDTDSGSSEGTGSVGGIGAIDTSAFETSMDDIANKTQQIANKILPYLTMIRDNWQILAGAILGAKVALALFQTGIGGLLSLGIGIIIAGIVALIIDLVTFIQDPSWQNFANILRDIAIILAGIAVAFIAVGLVAEGLILLVIAAVVLLVAVIIKYWDKIKAVLGAVWEWIDSNVITPVANLFSWLWETIKAIFTPVIDFFVAIFTTIWANIQVIIHNAIEIFKFLWNGIKAIFEPIADFFKKVFTTAFDAIKKVFSPIVNFFSDIWNKVSAKLKSFGAKVGEVVAGAFKGVVNGVLKAIENILNVPIKAINGLIKVINKVPGIDLQKLETFKLPRLAKGGIVNNPGPGVMMGSYIAGERGPEAVIPLDDNTLDRLGIAFARHTVINANITNTMNGRVISRELQKVNNESDFAYNR